MQTLAELLVEARSAAGLDQRAVAVRARVSRQTVDRWERGAAGRPRREHLFTVAKVLGIEVDRLLGAARYPAILESGSPSVASALVFPYCGAGMYVFRSQECGESKARR